jgi:hypothetical protein
MLDWEPKMLQYCLLFLAVFSLSACGGGGGSHRAASSGVSVLEKYNDNVALVRIKGTTLETEYVGVIDTEAAEEVLAGSITGLDITYSSYSGEWFEISRTGVMSSGRSITFDTTGVDLNASGSEYVSRSFVNTNQGGGYIVTGSNLGNLPAGAVSYEGYTEIYDASGGRETGDVTLNVNFNNNKATITGVTDNLIYSSSDISVSSSSGQFSSNSAQIGQRFGANIKVPARIEGSFYGASGNGMGGIVTGGLNADLTTGYLGSFAGTR